VDKPLARRCIYMCFDLFRVGMEYFHAFAHFDADLMLKSSVNMFILFGMLLKLQFVL